MTSFSRGGRLAEKSYRMDRDSLKKWLKSCMQNYELWAPNNLRFERIDEPEISFDYENTIVPPKDVVFPQTERLLRMDLSKNEIEALVPNKRKKIIFGVRPCDARAIKLLDIVFGEDFEDPYYSARRAESVVVVLACRDYCSEGFCNAVGGNPRDPSGADVMLTQLDEDNFYVEFITEEGMKLISDDLSACEMKVVELKLQPKYEKNLENAYEWLSDKFTSDKWEKFAKGCISCGICTFLCPTCHCFDITDTKHFRIRTWDSCQFPEFTVHTSSHNPRPEKMHRMRNRVLHKFLYFKQRNDVIACVGCGRCVRLCPQGIDIREIVEAMEE
jgi:ferredoxin